MQVRYSTAPTSAETATTADLRDSFLVEGLFVSGEVNATYTHDDRMVVGGAVPGTGQLDLPSYADVLGTESHLERRELGIINVGGAGHVVVDGEKFELEHLDGLYVGRGSEVSFAGAEAAYYFVSATAHATYPATHLTHTEVEPLALGSAAAANERSLFRYVWGQEVETSVLQFGVTVIADGSVSPRAFALLPATSLRPTSVAYATSDVIDLVPLAGREPGVPQSVADVPATDALTAADVNGDGAVDLVAASQGNLNVLRANLEGL